MRFSAAVMCLLLLGASQARAASFPPSDEKLEDIAHQFNDTMKESGVVGVGSDVLKCYDDNLSNKSAMKLCVIYDTTALIYDRSMKQIFIAHGMDGSPAPLFTNQVFDARQNTYGKIAFADAPGSRKLVGPLAQRVLNKVWALSKH